MLTPALAEQKNFRIASDWHNNVFRKHIGKLLQYDWSRPLLEPSLLICSLLKRGSNPQTITCPIRSGSPPFTKDILIMVRFLHLSLSLSCAVVPPKWLR